MCMVLCVVSVQHLILIKVMFCAFKKTNFIFYSSSRSGCVKVFFSIIEIYLL